MQLLALPKLIVFPHAQLVSTVYKSLLPLLANTAVLPNALPDLVVSASANWQAHRSIRLAARAAGQVFTAFSCGMLSPLKRPSDLVAAVNNMPPNTIQAHFVGSAVAARLVSDAAFNTEITNAASAPQPACGRFQFHGEVPHAQVQQLWPHADVYVSCSSDETQGMAALEAACHGVPPVLTDLPCYQGIWQHGHNALIYPVGDRSMLAQHLRSLMANPQLCSALGANARKTALGFDWKRFAQGFDAAVGKALNPDFPSGRGSIPSPVGRQFGRD
jgi:glycosyltransferase involved in cell wall biosynthesis